MLQSLSISHQYCCYCILIQTQKIKRNQSPTKTTGTPEITDITKITEITKINKTNEISKNLQNLLKTLLIYFPKSRPKSLSRCGRT